MALKRKHFIDHLDRAAVGRDRGLEQDRLQQLALRFLGERLNL